MTERIARASGRHPWRVLVIWIVVVVASVGTIVTFLESALEGEIAITSETESKRAEALLAEGFPPPPPEQDVTEVVVVRSEGGSVDDAPFSSACGGGKPSASSASARFDSVSLVIETSPSSALPRNVPIVPTAATVTTIQMASTRQGCRPLARATRSVTS